MPSFKKLLLLGIVAILLAESSLFAQEREPLAMRIELEWTAAWAGVGFMIGFATWLTDPGNPNNVLSQRLAEGAALGTFVGAIFGVYVMQTKIQYPQTAAMETPPALWGTGADPLTVRERGERLMAAEPSRPAFTLAAYRIDF
jgi:hypothetical protein